GSAVLLRENPPAQLILKSVEPRCARAHRLPELHIFAKNHLAGYPRSLPWRPRSGANPDRNHALSIAPGYALHPTLAPRYSNESPTLIYVDNDSLRATPAAKDKAHSLIESGCGIV